MFKKLINQLSRLYIKVLFKFTDEFSRSHLFRKFYGVKIGKNVRFTGLPSWGSEPYLIEIGDNVTITTEVIFFTHDGGVGIFRDEHPGLNIYGRIKVGNNVFIGARTIILPNVSVGNNVVIAAGSIVSKDVPDNVIVAGVPAKVVKSSEEYLEKSLKIGIFLTETDEKKRKEIIMQTPKLT